MTTRHDIVTTIATYGVDAYPNECCGVVLEMESGGLVVHPCRNIQNERHIEAPDMYSRTAETAYFIDPVELMTHLQSTNHLRYFYHTHVNTEPDFSDLDKAYALEDGRPTYPDVAYIIVSIYQEIATAYAIYEYNPIDKVYTRCENGILSPNDAHV